MEAHKTRAVRRKKLHMTNAEKSRLIASIKKRSLLWDLTDIYHNDYDKMQAAWNAVAQEVKRPVSDCKDGWVSLRDSLRYHRKRDLGNVQQDDEDDYDPLVATKKIDWRFAEAMSFLPQSSAKRPRTASPIAVSEADVKGEDGAIEADWMAVSTEIPEDDLLSAKSIKQEPKPKARSSVKSPESSSKASVVDMLSNFLKETRHCLEQPVSKNASVLAYWDTLLTGMSPQNSQRATFKVTEFLQEIAKKGAENKRRVY